MAPFVQIGVILCQHIKNWFIFCGYSPENPTTAAMIQFMHYRLHIAMRKNMINLRMIELYRLGIALLMLMFLAGRASAQANITVTENSGVPNDGFILCGAQVTLTANPPGNTYLWSTTATSQTITVVKAGTYTVTVTNSSGGTSTDSKVITVTNDNTAPVAKCDTITKELDTNGEVILALDDVDDGSFDACSLEPEQIAKRLLVCLIPCDSVQL
jgi:hypothetical protein